MGVKIDTFLGCLSLETGGKIIGWIDLVCCVIITIYSVAFLNVQNYRFGSFQRMNENGNQFGYNLAQLVSLEATSQFFIILAILGTVVGCIGIYAAHQLISGCYERKSSKIKLTFCLNLYLMVFSTASLFFTWPYAIVPFAINCYITISLYSLIWKFEEEEKKAAQASAGIVPMPQRLNINNEPSVPNCGEPAVVTISPNTFDYFTRHTPMAPPSYEVKF